MIDMYAMTSSDVRSEWSSVMDSVIRRRPAFIRRTRDRMMLCSVETIAQLMDMVQYTADRFEEEDGSITLSLSDLDIVVNAPDEASAIRGLATDIMEYADEYYENYELYAKAPNRARHLPFVMKAWSAQKPEELEGAIVCRNGKN